MSTAGEAGGSRSVSRLLVGRDDVLAELESLADEIVAGHRLGTLLVEGPAGIGKTRVVTELGARLEARGFDVLVGHCVAEGEQLLPYAPVMEVLAELVHREGSAAVLKAAGPAGPELGRLVPALEVRDVASPDVARSPRLFQALSTLLQNLSFTRPLLVVVEDVHWADTSTRDLLALLARQQAGDVVLLLTLRTDESPAPAGLARYLAELVRRSDRRIRLQPLSRDQQAHQVSDILGVPPHRQLLDEVYERAEGNPFFAEEVLALSRQGEAGLPVTVRDLLAARLEALAPATRQVLRTASMIGRTVPHRLLEAVVDVHGDRLEEVLRSAVGAHVLSVEGGRLTFRHALLQEAVADTLLPGEAARIHRRIAEALGRDPSLTGDSRVAGRLARHWDQAGDPARALTASVSAALEACDALAFAESLRHYERALELCELVPDPEGLLGLSRARLLAAAAESAHLSAQPDRATELVRAAIARLGPEDPVLHGTLHERLGRYLWMSADTAHALASYQRAVELVPADPPSRQRAAVLSGLSQMLMLAGRYTESEELARQAIAMAAALPDGRAVEGHARNNLGVDLARFGRMDEAITELRAAHRIAEELFEDVDDISRALVNLNAILQDDGRTDEALAVALENVEATERLGLQRRKGVWGRCSAAEALMMLGRLDEAGRMVEEARRLEPQGIDAFRADISEGQLELRRGDLERARTLLERARTAGANVIDPHLIGPLYTALVVVAGLQADHLSAQRWSEEGLGRMAETGHPAHLVPLLAASVADLVRGVPARPDDARALLEQAETAVTATLAPTRPTLADLRAAAAEVSGSADDWRAVAAAWEEIGDPYRSADAHLQVARTLLAAGADREAAAEHLRTALETARRIGAAGLLARAEDLGRRSRLRVEAAPDNPYRLTAREAEVLGLVAEGLGDRQIGSRLFISHRTVERHVSNLLAKLGADRRSELIATAHREGLLAASGDSPA